MYILDACTAINIIHIDADEFLQKKIERIGYHICKLVSTEIHQHVFDKFDNLGKPPEDETKRINIALTYYRYRIYYPEDYLGLADDISAMTGYVKNNGEFHSVLLSFFLFWDNGDEITFYTDDAPAKDFFSPYYVEHGVGKIEDLVDLLILLYGSYDDFTLTDLKKYLSNLFYEVARLLKGLERDINMFQIPKLLIKNKVFRTMIEGVRKAISQLDLKQLHILFYEVVDNKKEFPQLFELLNKYKDFFNQNISREYFDKIKNGMEMAS